LIVQVESFKHFFVIIALLDSDQELPGLHAVFERSVHFNGNHRKLHFFSCVFLAERLFNIVHIEMTFAVESIVFDFTREFDVVEVRVVFLPELIDLRCVCIICLA